MVVSFTERTLAPLLMPASYAGPSRFTSPIRGREYEKIPTTSLSSSSLQAGDTSISSVSVNRTTTNLDIAYSSYVISSVISLPASTGSSFIEITTSPGMNPAASAGESGLTLTIISLGLAMKTPCVQTLITKRTRARIAFISGPARTTDIFCQAFLFL